MSASLLKEDASFCRLKMLMVLLHESNMFTVKFCWQGGRNAVMAIPCDVFQSSKSFDLHVPIECF